eukprot:2915230-Rhodomonas_salina.2
MAAENELRRARSRHGGDGNHPSNLVEAMQHRDLPTHNVHKSDKLFKLCAGSFPCILRWLGKTVY